MKAGNGVVIAAAEEGFRQKRTALARVEAGWPDAVVTVEA